MEDLHNSPFFDRRLIDFTRRVMQGTRTPNPINATEQKISEMAIVLRELDKELETGLIRTLTDYQKYIPVGVCVQFLAGCHKRKVLPIGLEILDMMHRDERTANLPELVTILKESTNSADYLTLLVESREIEDRHKPMEKTNLSGLNLEAMKNFK